MIPFVNYYSLTLTNILIYIYAECMAKILRVSERYKRVSFWKFRLSGTRIGQIGKTTYL